MITLTENAAREVRRLHAAITEPDSLLRIFVEDGGCDGCGSDYHYGMSFDIPKNGDTTSESQGLRILIDAQSLPHLRGAMIDFGPKNGTSSFIIENPNAASTCGCGRSFSE